MKILSIKPDEKQQRIVFSVKVSSLKGAWPTIFPGEETTLKKQRHLFKVAHKKYSYMSVVVHPKIEELVLVPVWCYRIMEFKDGAWYAPWYPGDQEQDHNPDIHRTK